MFNGELVIDNFAGGGGASTGIERALNCTIDIAINHDAQALAMHAANHPDTIHLCENVWQVDIEKTIAGRPVALCWFSPDCKHFSKAKGRKPVEKKIRGLAWIVLKWAAIAKPRVIILENVEEFEEWGPVIPAFDKEGNPLFNKDGSRAMKPCPRRKGMTFKRWRTQLKNLGYEIEHKILAACDYGAGTTRERLFIVARRDGQKIKWPMPTHGPKGDMLLKPYVSAGDCINWNLPVKSIFNRKKPLKPNTLRRIAKGVQKYIIENAEPFIVPVTQTGSGDRVEPVDEPLRTITTAKGGEKALCSATLIKVNHGHQKDVFRGSDIKEPLGTITSKNGAAMVSAFMARHMGQSIGSDCQAPIGAFTAKSKDALVTAFMAQHNGGFYDGAGRPADAPLSTITSTGVQQQIVLSNLVKLRGKNIGQAVEEPLRTISAGGLHHAAVQVHAFLLKYYGTDQAPALEKPLDTITTKDRFAVVTVHGQEYVIVDIGMRMLTREELFACQGFPKGYQIAPIYEGKPLPIYASVRMCGYSVSPPPAEALVRANFEKELTDLLTSMEGFVCAQESNPQTYAAMAC